MNKQLSQQLSSQQLSPVTDQQALVNTLAAAIGRKVKVVIRNAFRYATGKARLTLTLNRVVNPVEANPMAWITQNVQAIVADARRVTAEYREWKGKPFLHRYVVEVGDSAVRVLTKMETRIIGANGFDAESVPSGATQVKLGGKTPMFQAFEATEPEWLETRLLTIYPEKNGEIVVAIGATQLKGSYVPVTAEEIRRMAYVGLIPAASEAPKAEVKEAANQEA